MDEQDRVLAGDVGQLMSRGGRGARRGRTLAADRTLQGLIGDPVTARAAPGMARQDVADRMPSTRSVVSRLESGVYTRPALTTIQKYARAVGAVIEIRVRARR